MIKRPGHGENFAKDRINSEKTLLGRAKKGGVRESRITERCKKNYTRVRRKKPNIEAGVEQINSKKISHHRSTL